MHSFCLCHLCFFYQSTSLRVNIEIRKAITYAQYLFKVFFVCAEDNIVPPIFNNQSLPSWNSYSFCSGDSLKLSITNVNQGDSLRWYYGTTIDSSNVSSKIFKDSTKLWVFRTDINGCIISSDTIQLNKFATPAIPTISNNRPLVFCNGDSTVLTSSTGIQWYNAGTAIISGTGISYTAKTNGNFTVKTTDSNGCSAISSSTSVTVNAVPTTPQLTSNNLVNFCQGGIDTLVSSTNIGNQWYLNGTAITNATTTSYIANSSGNYTDTVTNASGCKAGSLKTLITVNPLPSKPSITWNGSQFSTTATAVNYQWLLANSPVLGATSATYKPLAIGSYKVQVIDNNGCKNLSDSFLLVVTAVNTPASTPNGHIAKLFPNPASSAVMVQFLQVPSSTITIQLLNAGGQVIKEVNTNNQSTNISLNGILVGNYFLKIMGNGYEQTQQLMIKNK